MAQVDDHNDKNLSFWLNLLLLLAILLAALSLLYCCCYQQYLRVMHDKFHRVERVENKRIQATSPYSSEPADNERKVYILTERPLTPVRVAKKTMRTTVMSNVRVKKKTSAESLLLEDVEGNEYRMLDKRRSWSDETPDTRQEMFYKQGDAEILRIVSNDSLEVMDSASNVGAMNVFDELAGKKVIMNKFLNSRADNDGGGTAVGGDRHGEDVKANVEKTQAEEIVQKKNDIEEEQKEMAAFQRDVLLTKFLAEEQQKLMKLETRSLPGANMATQTEVHAGTQTTSSCLRARGGGGGGVRRSRSYEERDDGHGRPRAATYRPRRSSSLPRRHQPFNSPIIEETGSGSSLASLRPAVGEQRRQQQHSKQQRPLPVSSFSTTADARRSRSYSCLRELELDRQLQYMTPSLRSRALARRRLSASLPPSSGRRPDRAARMLEKKSVFTIAYGDAATQKINCSADSSSNCNWD